MVFQSGHFFCQITDWHSSKQVQWTEQFTRKKTQPNLWYLPIFLLTNSWLHFTELNFLWRLVFSKYFQTLAIQIHPNNSSTNTFWNKNNISSYREKYFRIRTKFLQITGQKTHENASCASCVCVSMWRIASFGCCLDFFSAIWSLSIMYMHILQHTAAWWQNWHWNKFP